jgi:hypothetical protein
MSTPAIWYSWRFVVHLRQAHDEGRQLRRLAVAYLSAAKAA